MGGLAFFSVHLRSNCRRGFSLVPVIVAVDTFSSWIALTNQMQIPCWPYYERTIYLIYLGRFLDLIAWILSSVFAVVLLVQCS